MHSWPDSHFACATLPAAPIMPQAIATCACSSHAPQTQNRFGKKLPIGSLSMFDVHSSGSMLSSLSMMELSSRPIRTLIVRVRCAGAGVDGSGPDETATAPAGKRRPTNASAPSLSLTLACWRRRGGDLHRRLGCAGDVTGGGGGQV